jgi:geranylgeranyl pyrophosphate synthase
MMNDAAAEAAYKRRVRLVNGGLDSVLPRPTVEPGRLHEAMRHGVFGGGGGKRLRPVILLTVASDLGVAEDRALAAAMALELVHGYSLVHDDLPCMDDAAERRGAAAVHAAYGYAEAVLAGDALLTLAFELLGRAANSGLPRQGDLVVELALAAGSLGMVGGQQADLDASGATAGRLPGPAHPILKLHGLKTAKLYGFAFSAPGYLAGAKAPVIRTLREAGQDFGLAFQIADDIRDAGSDRAPNYAQAAGATQARQTGLDAVARCQAALTATLGEPAEILALVHGASREMGL